VCSLGLAAWPAPARADDAAEAQLHFQLGATEFQARHYETALTHFLAANRLAPTANTIFNVAQTYLALHRDMDAYRFLRDYLAHPGATANERALATAAITRIEPHLARIEVLTTPPGATIFVDRTDVGDVGTSPRSLAVPPGAHQIIARLEGYGEQRLAVTATVGQTARAALTLTQILGGVHVASEPAGAAVLIDGQERGATPLDVPLPPGVHRIVLRREGYLDVSRELELHADQPATLEERLPVDLARSGVLSVSSSPPGAVVRFRGQVLGQTPLSASAVLPGAGALELERPGFAPLAQSVFVRVGHEHAVRAVLGRPGAQRPAWIPVMGIGGALVAAGGITLGVLALSARSDFYGNPDRGALDRANALSLACDLTLLAGLLLVAGGTTAWVLTPDPGRSRATVDDEVSHVRTH
jgi:hypothetical protein